jgi:hypothetical protein
MLSLPAGFGAALQRPPGLDGGNGRRRAVLALGALESAAHEGVRDEGGEGRKYDTVSYLGLDVGGQSSAGRRKAWFRHGLLLRAFDDT